MPSRSIAIGIVLLLATCTWSQEPTTLRGHGGWVGAVAFPPDSRRLAIGASDGSVSIWDMMLREKTVALQGHADAVAALAFSTDGLLLASGGHDRVAILHGLGRDPKLVGRHQVLRAHTGAVLSVALSPNGKRLFTGSIDGTVREWNTDTGSVSKVLGDHTSWINGLAIDRRDTLLASASSDNSLRLQRMGSFEELHTFRVKDGEIRAGAFAPNRKMVAAGIRYGGVRVWDVEEKKEVAALTAHAGETWAVAFTPDGKLLASGGGDWNKPGEIRLWEVGTWRERATLQHTGEVLCLAVAPDGRSLAAGSWDRTVRIWDLASLPGRPGP